MDELELDRQLHAAGAAFRESHTSAAHPVSLATRTAHRRFRLLLPLGTALATAAVVVAVTVVLPSGNDPKKPAPAATSFALPVTNLIDVELGDSVVAVAFGFGTSENRGGLEVRRRDDLADVVFHTRTSYPAGQLRCLSLTEDWLLWTDFEDVAGEGIPGPPARESLWLRNLRTGEQRRLLEHLAPGSPHSAPCAVSASGTAAWNPDDTHLTVLDLATGQARTSVVDGSVTAVLPSGLLLLRFRGDVLQIVLRSATTDEERLVRSVPRGIEVEGSGQRLVWFEKDPASDTADAGIVRTCTLPACSDVRLLAKDPSSGGGVVGAGFVVWHSLLETPTVVLFSGKGAPVLATGYIPFFAIAANGDTLAYCTVASELTPAEKVTLHLLTIR